MHALILKDQREVYIPNHNTNTFQGSNIKCHSYITSGFVSPHLTCEEQPQQTAGLTRAVATCSTRHWR